MQAHYLVYHITFNIPSGPLTRKAKRAAFAAGRFTVKPGPLLRFPTNPTAAARIRQLLGSGFDLPPNDGNLYYQEAMLQKHPTFLLQIIKLKE